MPKTIRENNPYANLLITAAERYCDQGFEVLLVHAKPTLYPDNKMRDGKLVPTPAKTPAPGFGPYSATRDPARIERFLELAAGKSSDTQPEQYGIAIPTGGKLLVLDDDRGGAIVKSWIEKKVISAKGATIVKTPRGGFHIWYAGIMGQRAANIAKGLDIKGHGGYVLVPPSTGYTFVKQSDGQLPEFPPKILNAIQEKQVETKVKMDHVSEATADRRAAKLFLKTVIAQLDSGRIELGTRNNTLFAWACQLANYGLAIPEMVDLMETLVLEPGIIEQVEGDVIDAEDIAVSCANAAKYSNEGTGSKSVETMFDEVPMPVADTKAKGFHTLSELLNWPEPDWLVQNLMTTGSPAVMFAASGQYKTFAALALAWSIATGTDFGPLKVHKQGPVLYIDLEGGLGMAKRIRGLWDHHGRTVKPDIYFYDGHFRFNDPAQIQKLLAVLRVLKPVLTIVDTYSQAIPGMKENDAESASLVVDCINRIRSETGTAFLLIAHTPKSGDHTTRGSGALDAAMHTRMTVDAGKIPSPDEIKLKVLHVKDGESRQGVTLHGVTTPDGGFAVVPKDNFIKIDDSSSNQDLNMVALEFIASGDGTALVSDLRDELMERFGLLTETAKRRTRQLDGREFAGGMFTISGTTTARSISWELSADAEDMLS